MAIICFIHLELLKALKMNIKHFFLFILFISAVFPNLAQTISGTVYEKTDQGKTPMTGVNVYWSGTQTGTSTDDKGNFVILASEPEKKLVVSFVGFKTDTVEVNNTGRHLEILLFSNLELEEVAIMKRKPGTHISRINPINSQKITGAELCKAACCNLSESFETNASVDVSYSDAVTGAKQIRLLGLDGTYVQLLTENYPNLRGLATSYGLEYIPGSWMESIQISKGTSAVTNGFEAITGQINVEYKKPQDSEKFFVNLLANDAGKREGNLNASILFNNKWSTMVLLHGETNQQKNDRNEDDFLDNPLVDNYQVMNRWDYFNPNGFSVRFGIKYLDENRESGQTDFRYSDNLHEDNGYGIGIKTSRIEGCGKAGYVFPDKPEASLGFITNFSNHYQDSYFGLTRYTGEQNSFYANLIYQSLLHNNEHKFNTGISYQYDAFFESMDDSTFNKTESIPGIFFQYIFTIENKFTALVGLRADLHNQYGLFYTPRLHVKYNPLESTTIRASVGKGYRTAHIIAENSYFLANSRSLLVEHELNREEAWNYGVNITQYVHVWNKELTLSTEFYRTDFINQVVVDLDSDVSKIRFYNLKGKSYSTNYQVELSYELFRGLDFRSAFRYNNVKTTIGNELREKPLISRYKGLLTMSYSTPLNKWQFDFTSQFNGKGRIPDTAGNPLPYRRSEESPAYSILNVQITKFFRKWNIYVGVENLTDFVQENPIIAADQPFGDYFDGSLIWGPIHGRKIYAGIRYSISRD